MRQDADFVAKLSLNGVRILVVGLLPAVAMSIYRALFTDGFVAGAAMHVALYTLLVLIAMKVIPTTHKARVLTIVVMASFVAMGALLRNYEVGIAYAYLLMASIYLSLLISGSLRYLFPIAAISAIATGGVILDVILWQTALGHAFGIGSLAVVSTYIFSNLVSYAQKRVQEESGLRQKLDESLATLSKEREWRTQVAKQANQAFIDYNFATGLLDGDEVLQARYGRSAGAGGFSLSDYPDKFSAEDAIVLQDAIVKAADLAEGEAFEFYHNEIIADGSVATHKVVGMRVVTEGVSHFLGASIDVTAERQTELRATQQAEQLERQAEQLSLLAESGQIAFFEVDLERGLMSGSPLLMEREGLPADADPIPLVAVSAKVPDYAREEFESNVAAVIAGGIGKVSVFTHPYHLPDGSIGHFKVAATTRMQEGRLFALGSSVEISEQINAQQSLQKQANQMEIAASTAGISFFTFDLEADRLYADATFNRRMGLPDDNPWVPLQLLLDTSAEENQGVILDNISKGLNDLPQGVHTTTLAQRFADGSVHQLRIVERFVERDGRRFAEGVSIDITDEVNRRREVERQAKQLDLLSFAGKIALFEYDIDSNSITGSREQLQRLGLDGDFEEFPLKDLIDRVPETARKALIDDVRGCIDLPVGEAAEFSHPQVYLDGSLHQIRVIALRTERDGRRIVAGASVDMTAETEAKLLAERTAESLKSEQDRQAQMYAVIGHELRTPTAALKMLLDVAQESDGHIDTEVFSSTIDQLLGVIDTLRSVAQPERMNEAAKESVVLADVLTTQATVLSTLAKSHNVALKLDLSALHNDRIEVRVQLFKQLISNLVKNAIVHSRGTQVEVVAQGQVADGVKTISIAVVDNGKGISPERQRHLFKAYERGETDAEGTGLGLFVCKEIARALGGDLVYQDNPGGGSRFVTRFSASLAADAATSASSADSGWQGVRVLLAEDNNTIRMLTKRMLESRGAQLVLATNGEEALSAAGEGEFDLILSDIFMPKMDGYAFVSALRERGIDVPVIGLTAATIGEETDRMLKAGANAVLSKPVRMSELQREYLALVEKV